MQHSLSFLLLASLAACAAPQPAPTAHGQSPSAALVSEASAEEASGQEPPTEPSEGAMSASLQSASAPLTAAQPPTQASHEPLAIWRDPNFQRRFAESYLAESEVEPTVTVVERDRLIEVRDAIAAEDLDEARALLARFRGEAASATFDFTLGNLDFQAEQLDAAGASYRTAVAKFPKFRRAWKNLGLVEVRQGHFEEAAAAFSRVIELGGGDALTYGLLGFAYLNEENQLAAESAYRLAILLDPKTDDWKMGLARSLFQQSRFQEAVSLTGAMIAKQPNRADLWLLQANAYLGQGEPLRAAENFELVDRLGAASVDSLNLLGDIYINAELFDLARDAYSRALSSDPGAYRERALRAANNLAARGALLETGAMLDAIQLAYADSLTPDEQVGVLRLRARLAVATGASEEELRLLEEIVALDPLDGEALLLLGMQAGRDGDYEHAIFYYERAAAIEAFEADAKVRHGQLLVGLGRYAEALPLLRRAQVVKPRANIQEYLEQVERVAQTH